jgi:AcrR family transcriptional regulator
MKARTRPKAPGRKPAREEGTRVALLEAAGQVFANKGFDRATVTEICELANANIAAVSYYFGGMDGLYAAVLREAHSRVLTNEGVTAIVAEYPTPQARLEALIGMMVQAIVGTPSTAWSLRVMSREAVNPSPPMDEVRKTIGLFANAPILRATVGELMGLPGDHAAVARACFTYMAPGALLLNGDRAAFKRAFPSLSLRPKDAAALIRHFLTYALAGFAAVAREAKKDDAAGAALERSA